MRELLDQIEARAEDARRHRELYGKESWSHRITNEESAKDVPRLLAAVRAVERVIRRAPDSNDYLDEWEDGRAALADEIRRALTEALEGEG